MHFFITGGCGFLGSNLAREALRRGHKLTVFDNLSRLGSSENLIWLKTFGDFNFIQADIQKADDVDKALLLSNPDIIFHLAGQVAMTTSLKEPRQDFEINVLGTINLLESLRISGSSATIVYSSTNKVYGDLEGLRYDEGTTRYKSTDFNNGFDEQVPLDFRSPYGCSKGSADQYMLDYHRNYGLNTIVFRHSSVFGSRQFSTFNQGWIGWFISQAILKKNGKLTKPITISGDGKQVRDVLFSSDLVNCYFNAIDKVSVCAGEAFNIGGGMQNSLSLLELFKTLEIELNIQLNFDCLPWRKNDQKVFVANITKAQTMFNWVPLVDKEQGIKEMIQWVAKCGE
jgi:CDP-paratose 2-epimerase|tara:strand:- start:1779 stop:2804 length:1026 start_codon:yes stop_codon:yes gene_type:complete